jgi:O-antigen/teichoic acid export membrane protein
MHSEKLIAKNTAFLSIGKFGGDLFTLVFLIYFARAFGVDFMGKYGFAMSMGGLLTVGVSLGMDTLLVREVSKDKSKNDLYFGNFLIAQTMTSFFSWSLIIVIAVLSNWSADTKWVVVIIGAYHTLFKFSGLFGSVFRAHEEMQYPALIETAHKVMILMLGSAGIYFFRNPLVALAAYPASGLARVAAGFLISTVKYGRPRFVVDIPFLKRALAGSMPFFFIIVIAQFYSRLGLILLTLLEGENQAGIYSAADRLMVSAGVVLPMFGTALFPSLSRLSHESNPEFLKLYERAIRLVITLTLPAAVVLFVLGGPIILTIFGEGFGESVWVLKILCWGLLLTGLKMMMNNMIIVKHYETTWLKVQTTVYLAYAAVCLIIIPFFGYVGLAYTRLGTELVMVIAANFFISKNIHAGNLVRVASPPLLSCASAITCYFLLSGWSIWVSVPAVLGVLIVTMFLFRAVQIHDLKFLRALLMTAERPSVEQDVEPVFIEKSGP